MTDESEMKHGALPQLEPLLVPIDSLNPDPRNARLHDERNIASVMESYKEHGQRKPIVVKLPERYIEAGNGQLEAVRRLGWTHIAAVFVEEDDHAARRYALRDNRSAELAEWDLRQLGIDLRELKDIGDDLEGLGWTQAEAEPLLVAEWGPGEDDPDYKPPGAGSGAHTVRFSKEQWEAIKPKADLYREAHEDASMTAALVALILKDLP